MLALMQTDTELGDIMVRAFILRMVELVADGMGDVVLIGSFEFVELKLVYYQGRIDSCEVTFPRASGRACNTRFKFIIWPCLFTVRPMLSPIDLCRSM